MARAGRPHVFQSTRPCGRDTRDGFRWRLRAAFQSTRPCGRDTVCRRPPVLGAAVSIHAPVWARHCGAALRCSLNLRFNPRARVGATLFTRQFLRRAAQVSIHAPVWARHVQAALLMASSPVVSIHAPVWARHQRRADVAQQRVLVSIHAPVWARHLLLRDDAQSGLDVSIHAPVWARHAQSAALAASPYSFNPRARVGATLAGAADCGARGAVSIHAPVWARHSNHRTPSPA